MIRDIIDFVRHFFEIAGLVMGAVMQDRGNDAITEQDDFIGMVFRVHMNFSFGLVMERVIVNYGAKLRSGKQ